MAKFNDKNLVPDFGNDSEENSLVWNTKLVEDLIDKVENGGLSLENVANPFHGRDTDLRRGKVPFELTQLEFKELIKCKNDVVYFANTYAKLLTPDGTVNITLYPPQEQMLKNYVNNKLCVTLGSRQIGKCIDFCSTVETKEYGEIPVFQLWYNTIQEKTALDYIKYGLYWCYWKLS